MMTFFFFCKEKSILIHYMSVSEGANAHNCQAMYSMGSVQGSLQLRLDLEQ